jgi:hypothetical protein
MRYVYQIDLKHQLGPFRKYFETLMLCMAGVLLGYFMWTGDKSIVEAIVLGLLGWFVVILPTVIFHSQYLLENWNTKMTIDQSNRTVEIDNGGGTCKYAFEDLKNERHLLGRYRPDRMKNWQPIPFDYYGYVKIKTKDNKVFYITSLMTDPFDFPLPISETKYRFPFINKTEYIFDDKRKQIEFTKNRKIEEYIERFSKLSNDTLLEKVNNSKKYEIEAVEAAEYLLSERQKITTANN